MIDVFYFYQLISNSKILSIYLIVKHIGNITHETDQ